QFFTWLVTVLNKYEEKETATEFSQVWQECKKQKSINDHQATVIVGALNKVLSIREIADSPGEQKAYAQNKKLFKNSLKAAIDNPEEWGKEDVAVLDNMYKS